VTASEALMRRWPWISLLLAAAFAISPVGQDFIYSAFFSGEQLSRNIAQPIFFMALAVTAVVVVVEWWIRWLISKPRLEN